MFGDLSKLIYYTINFSLIIMDYQRVKGLWLVYKSLR